MPLGYLEATRRYRWLSHSLASRSWKYNVRGIHVCVIGNFDTGPVPEDMKPAIGHVIRALQEKYHIADRNVMLHKEVNSTICPGRFLTKADLMTWAAAPPTDLSQTVRNQQDKVINTCSLNYRRLPRRVYLAVVGANSFVVLFAVGVAVLRGRTK